MAVFLWGPWKTLVLVFSSFSGLLGSSTQVPESLMSASRFVLPDSASRILQDPSDDRGIPFAEFLLLNNV